MRSLGQEKPYPPRPAVCYGELLGSLPLVREVRLPVVTPLLMLHFTNPYFLLLLLAIPPLLWWWRKQRGAAVRFPDTQRLRTMPRGRSDWARWGGVVLRAAALSLAVLALAGPRWPDRRTRIETEGIAIQMVMDTSGSMGETDFDWDGVPITRLDAVKRVFRLFVEGGTATGETQFEGRPFDLIGLVCFGTRPETPCPLTMSHSVLLRMLEDLKPFSVPGESETNISDALILGMHRLESAGPRRKVMILLSDGEHNVPTPPSGLTPRQAAQVAGNLGVRVYTINAGGDPALRLEPGAAEESAANQVEAQRILTEVAAITGGKTFTARDTQSLLGVLKEIDGLERDRIVTFRYRRYHEGFPWFALTSFALWALVIVLEMTVWQRAP